MKVDLMVRKRCVKKKDCFLLCPCNTLDHKAQVLQVARVGEMPRQAPVKSSELG
jgi:hypothetical protein